MVEWGDLIKIALTSSVFSAVVTFGFNCFLKKQDYKRDYYKKIIEKRLDAYEKLQLFLGGFCVKKEILDATKNEKPGEGFYIFNCFYEPELLRKEIESILKALEYSVWYSDDININLVNINDLLAEAGSLLNKPTAITEKDISKYKLTEKHIGDNLLIYIGNKVYLEIKGYTSSIRASINRDFLKMDKVDDFLKNSRK
jgi:hypothetical protein